MPRSLRFGQFELDPGTLEIYKEGQRIRLQEQPCEVLALLLGRPGELVTREELRKKLWPNDTFVDFDHGVNIAINKLRAALGDSAEKPHFIETLPRRGYRWIGPVEHADSTEVTAGAPGRQFPLWLVGAVVVVAMVAVLVWRLPAFFGKRAAVPGAPKALAVIEIENLSQDPSLDWLGYGVVDLLTTDLAQAKDLDVISTERIRSLVGRQVKPGESLPAGRAQQVATEAGVDVFVSGALLKIGQGIRLDLRVQDTATGKVLLADKVEGENSQAIFSMVDKATARITSELAPAGGRLKAKSAASLTSNLDALHAYEEGVGYFDRSIYSRAIASFHRATQLDPEFAMAYYRLGRALDFSAGSPQEERQAIAQADKLAQRLPLPELQKLLIQAEDYAAEGRLEDAVLVLQTAVRLMPKEVGPRAGLVDYLFGLGRFSEAIAEGEEAVRLDPKQAKAYVFLAYSYAQSGDLLRALGAVNKYAALLPPNDPNPIELRGDASFSNDRFEDAIAQYRKNVELNPDFEEFATLSEIKIALAYVQEGKYPAAETLARSEYEKASGSHRAYAASALGDIAVARGRFDRAAANYAEAAKLFADEKPDVARTELWKAAEIYFEQRQPQEALAWASRHPGPGAAEIRAVACLLLGRGSAAEKEFAVARAALAPLFGDYQAEKLIALDRLRAASYAGHWAEVIAGWPQMPGLLAWHQSFQLGRAYAETGMLGQAEIKLQHARIVTLDLSQSALIAGNDSLYSVLTEFYLAKVLEQEGRKTDALKLYRGFLSHFENSAAHLPQIPEAQAALKRLL